LEENRDIHVVRDKELNRAFSKYLFLCSFRNNPKYIEWNTTDLLERIYKSFYEGVANNKTIVGQKAFMEVLKMLQSDDGYVQIYPSLIASHWNIHLILSRHILLREYIVKDETDKGIMESLIKLIQSINAFKQIIVENSIRRVDGLQRKLVNGWIGIVDLENEFFGRVGEYLSEGVS